MHASGGMTLFSCVFYFVVSLVAFSCEFWVGDLGIRGDCLQLCIPVQEQARLS